MRQYRKKVSFQPTPEIRERLIRELNRLTDVEGATVYAARLINHALDKTLPPGPSADEAIPITEDKPPKKPRLMQSA